ncbi:MAG: putative peptidase [Saprospiraceae bacterium]|jgi:predicted peptidase
MRILLFLILLGSTYSLEGQDNKSHFTKKSFKAKSGHLLPYRIAIPPESKLTKKPLLLFLHGAGERGDDNEKQLTHGASFLSKAVTKHNAIVITPQCKKESYWSSVDVDRSSMPLELSFDYHRKDITPDLQAVRELINEIRRTYNIDHKRIYVMGLSMGAMGTFEIVNRFPKCFAAAVPICGGGDSINYTSKARKVPFWIMHGDTDAVVSVNESREMVSALKDKRYDVRYTEYPGVNHNSWDNAFVEPGLLDWVFGHRR